MGMDCCGGFRPRKTPLLMKRGTPPSQQKYVEDNLDQKDSADWKQSKFSLVR